MYASEKVYVFHSVRPPETRFQYQQKQLRAGALAGSTNVFQTTLVTVHEVELRKTVITKLGKRSIWLSEDIEQSSLHSLPESWTVGRQNIRNKDKSV